MKTAGAGLHTKNGRIAADSLLTSTDRTSCKAYEDPQGCSKNNSIA
jgi:hypothetical protein